MPREIATVNGGSIWRQLRLVVYPTICRVYTSQVVSRISAINRIVYGILLHQPSVRLHEINALFSTNWIQPPILASLLWPYQGPAKGIRDQGKYDAGRPVAAVTVLYGESTYSKSNHKWSRELVEMNGSPTSRYSNANSGSETPLGSCIALTINHDVKYLAETICIAHQQLTGNKKPQ